MPTPMASRGGHSGMGREVGYLLRSMFYMIYPSNGNQNCPEVATIGGDLTG